MPENTDTDRQVVLIHPRIPVDLHAQIRRYAEETHRTLNGAVVALLEEAARNLPSTTSTKDSH